MIENVLCRMFRHACAFDDCAKQLEIEPSSVEYRTWSHSVAGIVNAAFACEIFIKTLLVFQDMPIRDIRGHDIKKLWSNLKEKDLETTSYIEKWMQEKFCSENDNMFDELLDNISNAFEHYRYIYEHESSTINPQYLRFLRSVLKEVCCMKLYRKSWHEYIDGN